MQNYRRCTNWISITHLYLLFKSVKSKLILLKTDTVLEKPWKKISRGFIFAERKIRQISWMLIFAKINLREQLTSRKSFSTKINLPKVDYWQTKENVLLQEQSLCYPFAYISFNVKRKYFREIVFIKKN